MNPLLVIIATLAIAAIVWLALLLVLHLAHLDGDE